MLVLPAMITDYWSSLNISSKQIEWVLDKALPGIVLSKQSISLDSDNLTDTFTITRSGNGVISISSSDTSIATVSLSDTTATVTAQANGSCTIIISVAESTDGNYLSNSSTLSVTCNLIRPLADCTPEQIQSIVNEGKASTNWSIGDTTSAITMNGNVSDGLTLSNYQCKAILIGLDHNTVKETDGKSSAHFILGKDTSNNEIAFCDFSGRSWTSKVNGKWFNHKNTARNTGGWASSNIKTIILPEFQSALPSAWQNILGTVTKYSDNTGGTSADEASYVTATSDRLFLLAEWEVLGTCVRANSAEQNSQQQYTYFANGNGKIRYNHQTTGSPVHWWLRSAHSLSNTAFVIVTSGGSSDCWDARITYGVVPGFAVVKS